MWLSLMAQGHQNLLGFSLGPTFPTSDFGSKDLDNYSAGFANTGVIIDFTFSHYWENNIGFEAILRSQSNTQDVQSLANGLVARFPGDVVTVESSSWQLGGSLVGVGQRFALSEKVHFGTRLLAGILSATSPDMTIITEYSELAAETAKWSGGTPPECSEPEHVKKLAEIAAKLAKAAATMY